jgi:hypothetical protein
LPQYTLPSRDSTAVQKSASALAEYVSPPTETMRLCFEVLVSIRFRHNAGAL